MALGVDAGELFVGEGARKEIADHVAKVQGQQSEKGLDIKISIRRELTKCDAYNLIVEKRKAAKMRSDAIG